jgi:hypothetical protein
LPIFNTLKGVSSRNSLCHIDAMSEFAFRVVPENTVYKTFFLAII